MQQYPFHHQWKKERMEELFVAILSMLLLAALIPLYLWKRRQAPRSPDHAEEDVQVCSFRFFLYFPWNSHNIRDFNSWIIGIMKDAFGCLLNFINFRCWFWLVFFFVEIIKLEGICRFRRGKLWYEQRVIDACEGDRLLLPAPLQPL